MITPSKFSTRTKQSLQSGVQTRDRSVKVAGLLLLSIKELN